ncbi:MAG: hypothetical protein V9G04_13705 [Nocardioides sp.]|jgi:copper(I)-binding protein
MHARRSFLSAVAAAALAFPALTACGFDMGTNREYQPGAGSNEVGEISVLNAAIVAATPDRGSFVASINNGTDDAIKLTSIESGGAGDITVRNVGNVEVAKHGLVNLAAAAEPIVAFGKFELGNNVDLVLSFDNGSTVEVTVPVVANVGQWEDIPVPSAPE